MKFSLVFSAIAAVVATAVSAQSVTVVGGQPEEMIRIASRDVLDRATALLNKNTVSTDNNAFLSRSNAVFLQNDRLAMRRRVMESLLRSADAQPPTTMSAAVLAKSMLRTLAAPTTDTALMAKASAVVAAAARGRVRVRSSDAAAMLVKRIADLVDAVGMREMDQEEAIRLETPRGVRVLVGTKDQLRQPSTPVATNDEPMYRVAIVYLKDRDEQLRDNGQEQWGAWGAGYGLGWRYPLGYWNAYGAGLYGGGCGLGFARAGFYYC